MRWTDKILKTNPLIKHSLRQKKEASEMDESMLSADKEVKILKTHPTKKQLGNEK